MMSPYSYFDCLSLGKRLQEVLGNIAAGEIHLFSYLACLLFLYKGNPVSEWEYDFIGTQQGGPFSRAVDNALSTLIATGNIAEDGGFLVVTKAGLDEYTLLYELAQNRQREPYLEGACSSLLTIPIGLIRNALFQEPELKNLLRLDDVQLLLDEQGPGLQQLHEHFAALSEAVGIDVQDLMVPAVVWLTYLTQVSQETVDN